MEPTVDVTICDHAALVVVPPAVLDDNRVSLEQLPGALEAEAPLPDIALALHLVELQVHGWT
jgi:hypothetical protein